MKKAKLFQNGQSQAVRLPKNCRFSGAEVYIKKIGEIVMLIPADKPWDSMLKSLDQFSDDFMESRDQPEQQKRDEL